MVKVRALRSGYYNHRLYKEGAVFEMAEEFYHPEVHKKVGRGPCTWVEAIEGFELNENTGKVVAKKKLKKEE